MKYRHRLLTAIAVHETAVAKFTNEEYLTGIFRDKLRRSLFVFTERDQRNFFDGNPNTILNLCICGNFAFHRRGEVKCLNFLNRLNEIAQLGYKVQLSII